MKKHSLILCVLFLLFQLAKAQTPVTVLQYYNTTTHKHFYTTNGTEITAGQNGWVQQASLGNLFLTPVGNTTPRVYRFYQTSSAAHYYSNSSTIAPDGFHLEGIMAYETEPPVAAFGNQKPVYEFFNSSTGDYYYSTSSAAVTGYQKNPGVAFHVY